MKNNKLIILTLSIVIATLSSALLPSPSRAQRVMAKIQQTGVLRYAMRKDAVPFGFSQPGSNEWNGYCLDFARTVRDRLTRRLGREIKTEYVQSTAETRRDLVSNGRVDIECGPNTIKFGDYQVDYSIPFFVTGTQFLVRRENQNQLNPFYSNMQGLKIGVVAGTLTERFLGYRYPGAEARSFRTTVGPEYQDARLQAMNALKKGDIIAIAGDGILLRGELSWQSQSENLAIVPELPLTCDYYGMLLPKGDYQWQEFVNSVLLSPQHDGILTEYFGSGSRYEYVQPRNFCGATSQ